MAVGNSTNNSKTIPGNPPGLVCPAQITQAEWLGGHTHNDTFRVEVNGSDVVVTRGGTRQGTAIVTMVPAFVTQKVGNELCIDSDQMSTSNNFGRKATHFETNSDEGKLACHQDCIDAGDMCQFVMYHPGAGYCTGFTQCTRAKRAPIKGIQVATRVVTESVVDGWSMDLQFTCDKIADDTLWKPWVIKPCVNYLKQSSSTKVCDVENATLPEARQSGKTGLRLQFQEGEHYAAPALSKTLSDPTLCGRMAFDMRLGATFLNNTLDGGKIPAGMIDLASQLRYNSGYGGNPPIRTSQNINGDGFSVRTTFYGKGDQTQPKRKVGVSLYIYHQHQMSHIGDEIFVGWATPGDFHTTEVIADLGQKVVYGRMSGYPWVVLPIEVGPNTTIGKYFVEGYYGGLNKAPFALDADIDNFVFEKCNSGSVLDDYKITLPEDPTYYHLNRTWQRLNNQSCVNGYDKSAKSFGQMLADCAVDEKCFGVYDFGCTGSSFALCAKGTTFGGDERIFRPKQNSCTYALTADDGLPAPRFTRGDVWEIAKDSSCKNTYTIPYSRDLAKTKEDCINDEDCMGIYDYRCDNDGFAFCSRAIFSNELKTAKKGSCVHELIDEGTTATSPPATTIATTLTSATTTMITKTTTTTSTTKTPTQTTKPTTVTGTTVVTGTIETTTGTTRTQTTKTITITRTTTTLYDQKNVDCVEREDPCTIVCETASMRNYQVSTPPVQDGRQCVGPTDCLPGDGTCPTTTPSTSPEQTTASPFETIPAVGFDLTTFALPSVTPTYQTSDPTSTPSEPNQASNTTQATGERSIPGHVATTIVLVVLLVIGFLVGIVLWRTGCCGRVVAATPDNEGLWNPAVSYNNPAYVTPGTSAAALHIEAAITPSSMLVSPANKHTISPTAEPVKTGTKAPSTGQGGNVNMVLVKPANPSGPSFGSGTGVMVQPANPFSSSFGSGTDDTQC